MTNIKEVIAKRASQELQPGSIINLGIGIPTLVSRFLDSSQYYFHTENGLLGVKELVNKEQHDPFIINAGKLPIAEEIGASYFDSATSFGMIRGGHIDVAILGALQVDEDGFIANWAVPGKNILGVGGAMDLLTGVQKVIVATSHTSKNGEPKFVKSCVYPITSIRKVDMIITELAVFERIDGKWALTEIMPGSSLEEIKAKTTANFYVDKSIKEIY